MRGILIDPTSQQVAEVEDDFSDFRAIQRAIGAKPFTTVRLPEDHRLFLDDEGLLRASPGPFFRLERLRPGETFAGRGLILRVSPEGETLPAAVDVETIWGLVSFPDVQFLRLEQSTKEEEHPIFGRMAVFRQKAIFGPRLYPTTEEKDGKGN